jgi:hypothetical protein
MRKVSLADIAAKGIKAIPQKTVSYLMDGSKPLSVLVPLNIFEELVTAQEDLEDIQAIDERRHEPTVPFHMAFTATSPSSPPSPAPNPA